MHRSDGGGMSASGSGPANRLRARTAAGIIAAALAAAAAPGIAAGADSGSNVRLYGRFDAGLHYLHGVRTADGARASRLAAQSGDWGASWLGLTGTEQLGGGEAIVFWLEQGLNFKDGSVAGASAGTGDAFSRKATIGWSSRALGTVTLGRDILLSNGQWDIDPMMNELSSGNTLLRSRNALIGNNLVQYQSPTWAGVDMLAQFGLSEQTDLADPRKAGQHGRVRGVQVTYRQPGVEVRAQFNDLYDEYGKLGNLFTASREGFVGVAWNASASLLLQAGWNHLLAPDSAPGLADRADQLRLGGQYWSSKQLQLTAGVYRIQVRGGAGDATHDGAGHATMLAAGALYYFSPVTFTYLSAARVHNGAGSSFGVGSNTPGSANLDNPAAGHAQSGIYAGLVTGF
jgi:predicted porin